MRPICSARSAPNAEPAPPWCCRPATPKPCTFISTRSPPRLPSAPMPFSSSIKPDGMAPQLSRFPTTSRSCHCPRALPNSTVKKISGSSCVHASELAIEPDLQIFRRYRRSLLLRLEHPHRSAVEDHLDRQPRLGRRQSVNLRIGIMQITQSSNTWHFAKQGSPPTICVF